MNMQTNAETHPMERLLRMDRIPHIWCPTCGIGTTMTALAMAFEQLNLDLDKVAVVSGIGCTGRVAGYIKVDSFHSTHGRALPFALGLHIARPDMKIVVFSGDGDLISIGGNHLIHTARRNVDITVVCVNNFIYAMTGGQVAPTTPPPARSATSPFGTFEQPFNLPLLAASSGAVYVARWTALHIRRLATSIKEAITKKGILVCRGHRPLLDSVCPSQQARYRPGPDEILPRQQHHQAWGQSQRGGNRFPIQDRRRQVRRYRTANLYRIDE